MPSTFPYTKVSILQEPSSDLNNAHYNNKTTHRYPLGSHAMPQRSAHHPTHAIVTNFEYLAATQLLAQHLFHIESMVPKKP